MFGEVGYVEIVTGPGIPTWDPQSEENAQSYPREAALQVG